MRTVPSARARCCVLWPLAFTLILLSASPAAAQGQRAMACCPSASRAAIQSRVAECYEQQAQSSEDYCSIRAYILVTTSGDKFCVDPRARWLKQKLKMLAKPEGVTDPLRPCGPSSRPPQGPDSAPPENRNRPSRWRSSEGCDWSAH